MNYYKYSVAASTVQRLDLFCAELLAGNEKMQDLWKVVKMVLTLSHGNASVEGGFSINKELLIDNMTEDTIVSQRVVFDAIRSANMAVNKVEVTSKMIASVKQAHAQYKMALQAKQVQQSEEQKAAREARKRKSDIESLQQQKKLKMDEAKATTAEIDQKMLS